jgi:hypothetical protein
METSFVEFSARKKGASLDLELIPLKQHHDPSLPHLKKPDKNYLMFQALINRKYERKKKDDTFCHQRSVSCD